MIRYVCNDAINDVIRFGSLIWTNENVIECFTLIFQGFDVADIKGSKVIKHQEEFFCLCALMWRVVLWSMKIFQNVITGMWKMFTWLGPGQVASTNLLERKCPFISIEMKFWWSLGPLAVLVKINWEELQKERATRCPSKLANILLRVLVGLKPPEEALRELRETF